MRVGINFERDINYTCSNFKVLLRDRLITKRVGKNYTFTSIIKKVTHLFY